MVWYRPDIKNICCLGQACIPQGFRIDGATANANLGKTTMLFADVNGDGKPDLIMTGYNSTLGHYGIYVIFGQSSSYSWPDPFNVSTLNGTNGFFADMGTTAVATVMAMDFNGDTTTDLVIENASGKVYVPFGQTAAQNAFPATVTLSSLTNATNPKGMIMGNTSSSSTVSLAHGDVNGDGIDDLIIGMYYANGDYSQSGRVFTIFGTATPPSTLAYSSLYPGQALTSSYATYTTGQFTVGTGAHTISFIGIVDATYWAVLTNAGDKPG